MSCCFSLASVLCDCYKDSGGSSGSKYTIVLRCSDLRKGKLNSSGVPLRSRSSSTHPKLGGGNTDILAPLAQHNQCTPLNDNTENNFHRSQKGRRWTGRSQTGNVVRNYSGDCLPCCAHVFIRTSGISAQVQPGTQANNCNP